MRAVLWWGADDSSWSPKVPLHGGATLVHASYDDQDCIGRSECRRLRGLPGTITDFSFNNAWWVNNIVADVVYTRFDRAKDIVLAAKKDLDDELSESLAIAEREAIALADQDLSDEVIAVLTRHAVDATKKALDAWTHLWSRLMVLFIDGKITQPDPSNGVCGCSKVSASFTDSWKAKVVGDTGDKYEEPATGDLTTPPVDRDRSSRRVKRNGDGRRHGSVPKLSIRGVTGAAPTYA